MIYNVKISIYDYLMDLYQRFREMCENKHDLCDLQNVSFEGGSLPDYSQEIISLLYCLRYHYGYAFEYEEIYKVIIDEFKSTDTISVLSIGCGNGIDLWSLFHAARLNKINKIVYTGIDCIDWFDKFDIELPHSAEYYNCNLCDAGDIIDFIDGLDVLIFPKSISEMKIADLKLLEDRIKKNTNKLIILSTFRKNDYNRNEDISKFQNFCSLFKQDGFEITKGDLDKYCIWEKDVGIRAERYDYVYPQEALDYLADLHLNCSDYDSENRTCSKICPEKLTRMPILKTNTICFNYIKLERK